MVSLWQKETNMKIVTKFPCHLDEIGQIVACTYLLIQSSDKLYSVLLDAKIGVSKSQESLLQQD